MALKPLRYWGGEPSTQAQYDEWNRERESDFRSQRDQEFYAKYGFFPGQGKQVAGAQDAAEQEWQQIVQAMEGQLGSLQDNETLSRLRSHYEGIMSGQDAPYDSRTIASLTSAATDPLARNARGTLERLRESFAARGLGRSGALGSLENRVLTDAATGSVRAAGDVRNRATEANYGARERAAAGLQGSYDRQQSDVNAMTSELARLRAQRSYDPTQFNPGLNRTTPSQGGYSTGYSPPPKQNRRKTGSSAPKYSFSSTGGGGYT
jgi:hypothetical protein